MRPASYGIIQPMMLSAPFLRPCILAWEVTRRCPLHCRHCRAGAENTPYSDELTTEECKQVIDSLAHEEAAACADKEPLVAGETHSESGARTFAKGAKPPQPPTMIIWTGGEPMLRPDILTLVRHATTRRLRSVMAPCGLLVTEERLAALKEAGIMACSFSLDGPDAATHDAFRGVAGAYDNVTRAMKTARAIGMPFQINVTVSTLNIDKLDALYDQALALGAAKLDLFFLVPVGRGSSLAAYALSAEQTRRTLDWAFQKAAAGPLPIKETCCPSAPAYWAACGGAQTCGPRPCGCLGGRGFAFLSHTGMLQTCGFIDVPCGNIRDTNFDLPALAARAVNPLGTTGTCRAADQVNA